MNYDPLSHDYSEDIRQLLEEAFSALEPPPRLLVSEWADNYRQLSPEASAEPGQWVTDRAPYQRGIMDAFNDATVETVVVMTSAQVGKTETVNNVVGYYVSQDPSPILVVQPTLEMAETWSKDRLAPMLRDTPVLQGTIKDARSRDSGNTLLHKQFTGGHITMAGANSAASLASRPIRIVLCDEVDRYPHSAGTEGDPVGLAFKRSNNFWNRKKGLFSTPTDKDSSRIEAAFLQSDQRRYFMPCPHCGEHDYLSWKRVIDGKEVFLVRWPEGAPHEAWYVCPHCGGIINDLDKLRMLSKGEWRSTAKGTRGIAGFHIWEAYSPWRTFGDIASDFVMAKATPDTLKTWVNTCLGEVWEENYTKKLDSEGLATRREDYEEGTADYGAAFATMGVDVQDDRLELTTYAFGAGEEAWLVRYRQIYGDPLDLGPNGPWAELDVERGQPITLRDGRQIPLLLTAVDSGDGDSTHTVYEYARKRQASVIAVKGHNQMGKPAIGRPSAQDVNYKGKVLKKAVKLYMIGTDTIKAVIYGRLKMDKEAGAGVFHFYKDTPDSYFAQLTAEKQQLKHVNGFPKKSWVKKAGDRNEALDCTVYAYAALQALYMRFNRQTIFEQFLKKLGPITVKQAPLQEEKNNGTIERPSMEATVSKLRRSTPGRPRSFVQGWR